MTLFHFLRFAINTFAIRLVIYEKAIDQNSLTSRPIDPNDTRPSKSFVHKYVR